MNMEQLLNFAKDSKSYSLLNLFSEFVDSHFDEIKVLNDYEKRKTLKELIKLYEIDDLDALRIRFQIDDKFQYLASDEMIDKIIVNIEQIRGKTNE